MCKACKAPNAFKCLDCKVCTSCNDEYYMIKDSLWNRVVGANGMLCVGCLESRLGRTLKKADFTKCEVNRGVVYPLSVRLRERLGQA